MKSQVIISCEGGPLHGHRIGYRGKVFVHHEMPEEPKLSARFWHVHDGLMKENVRMVPHRYEFVEVHCRWPNGTISSAYVYVHESLDRDEVANQLLERLS